MGRLFFLTTLQPDDHGMRIAEDAVHHRFRSEAPETVGIGKTLVGVHTSTYSNLNTPTTKKALSFLLTSHFLDKIYPLGMQKSPNTYGLSTFACFDSGIGACTILKPIVWLP